MLLNKVVKIIKDADKEQLFCTDANTEFINVINRIADVNSPHDIHKTLTAYFEHFLQNNQEESPHYIQAQTCLRVLDQYFNNLVLNTLNNNNKVNIGNIQPFDDEFRKLNGFEVGNDAEEVEDMQINPSNQQFVSEDILQEGKPKTEENTKVKPEEEVRILDEKTFRNEYVNDVETGSFFVMREEYENIRKSDFNDEILDIYKNSLKLFAREVNEECLHRHCYYLETDGKWSKETKNE